MMQAARFIRIHRNHNCGRSDTNFNNPGTTLGTSTFGKIFGADRAREIEIAVKYTF